LKVDTTRTIWINEGDESQETESSTTNLTLPLHRLHQTHLNLLPQLVTNNPTATVAKVLNQFNDRAGLLVPNEKDLKNIIVREDRTRWTRDKPLGGVARVKLWRETATLSGIVQSPNVLIHCSRGKVPY
jgi:hypothetical protein